MTNGECVVPVAVQLSTLEALRPGLFDNNIVPIGNLLTVLSARELPIPYISAVNSGVGLKWTTSRWKIIVTIGHSGSKLWLFATEDSGTGIDLTYASDSASITKLADILESLLVW